MLLALRVKNNMKLHHIDVEQVFIQASVEEEIHIELPEKYQDFPGAVGKLNRSSYGLVQASRNWNAKLKEALMDIGFEQSMVVPCLLRNFKNDELEILAVVHEDDILAGSNGKWR